MEERPRESSIIRIVTKYGILQGVVWFTVFLVRTLTGVPTSWLETVVEAAPLVLLMVVTHREFKKTHDGMMTYPQGLGSGTLLASEAALVTCVLIYIYVSYINTGYIASAIELKRAALEQRGITGAQAQQAMAVLSATTTPVGVGVRWLIWGVILGFIVALVVSIFTQKGDSRDVI
jgi:hypothetical protein